MRRCISQVSIMANEEMVYFLLTRNDALEQLRKIVKEVSEVLGLSSTTLVRLLLNNYHWDQDTLTDRYWEDPDRLFRTLKLPNPNLSPSINYNPLSPSADVTGSLMSTLRSSNVILCRTCISEKPLNEFYALSCGHQHCFKCWQSYLESSITESGSRQKISCLSRCDQIVEDEQVLKLLGNNERLKTRYQDLLIDSFVDTNRLTKWCPGGSCSTIVKIQSYSTNCAQMIVCDTCKTIFCFQCQKQWHDPIQCLLLQKWEKKNRDESMTGEWIIGNTKECPGCHAAIEKNGGCNHMTCRKPGCGHEFCWICFGPWKDHASRQCNVYREGETDKIQISAREILARYMHYFTRYQVHSQSLDLEQKLWNQVEQRISEMQAGSMSFTEQQAIYKAFNVLQDCRRTLKYTFAFAFYLYRNNQAEVFEQNQADLEQATEALSGFLEQEIDVEHNTSTKLMDKTRYCEHRRNILLNHCKEGYAEHYWGGLDPY